MVTEQEIVRELFVKIIKSKPNIQSIDNKWLIGTLRDQYNPKREIQHSDCSKEINGLADCLSWGIVSGILSLESKILNHDEVSKSLIKLVEQYGMQKELAFWCIESWCIALGISIDSQKFNHFSDTFDQTYDKPERNPTKSYTEQLFDDYVYEKLENTQIDTKTKQELIIKGKQLGITEDHISQIIEAVLKRIADNNQKVVINPIVNQEEALIEDNHITESDIKSEKGNIIVDKKEEIIQTQLTPLEIKAQYEKHQADIQLGTKWVNEGGWWMFGHDPKHSRCSPNLGPISNNLKWKFKTENGIYSSPSISPDGTIYVGSKDGFLYAINPKGTLKWKFKTEKWIYSSPAVGIDGTVYFGSGDGKVYSINPDSSIKWIINLGDTIQSSPVVGSNGVIYVGCRNKLLYAINPNGSIIWSFTAGDHIFSSPSIGTDGTIYFGCDDYKLYAVQSSGNLLWTYETEGRVWSSPAIDKAENIIFGSRDGKLYSLYPSGLPRWIFNTGVWLGQYCIHSSPAIGPDGTLFIGSEDKHLYAVTPNGKIKWSFNTGEEVSSSPAVGADGTVYVGSLDHNIYSVNSAGEMVWLFITEGEIYSSPTIGPDGTLYVGSYDGYLYAIGISEFNINPLL